MAERHDETISEAVMIDGVSFNNCIFENAQLIYEGGQPPQFNNCRFKNARFTFQESAGNTLLFLRAMSPKATNMRDVVVGLMPELFEN